MATTVYMWSELPPDILTLIGKRLESRIDVLRFRSVCSSWRSSLPFGTWPPRLPLTLPFPIIPHRHPHSRGHYTLTEATVYRLQPLHNPSDSPPKAWIIKVSENLSEGKMRLLNPLSIDDKITPLPRNFPTTLDLSQFRISEICRSFSLGIAYDFNNLDCFDQFNSAQEYQDMVNRVEKAVLLNNFTLVAMHFNGDLAVLRIGEPYGDLINFKGKVYVVNSWGESLIIDSSLNIRVFSSFKTPLNNPVGKEKHLVESCGELWLLDRDLRGLSGNVWYYSDIHTLAFKHWKKKEIWFKAYKLNEEEHKWIEVPDLGDRILFAGSDCSFSVSAADFEGCNCKGNCVFFMNSCSNFRGNHDDYDALRGSDGKEPEIYHIGDHCVGQLVAYPGYADLFWPLPSWLASGSSSSQS